MTTTQAIEEMMAKAQKAQKEFEKLNQEQVDLAVKTVAKTVYNNAALLAGLAISETKMGVYEDKVIKNQNKAKLVWQSLKDRKSVGLIKQDHQKGLLYIARPMGVVCSVTPSTNPIVTPMSNAMFALKGRNAIIIAPHPHSKFCSSKTVELCRKTLESLGYPHDIIQIIKEPSIKLTNQLMQQCDVVVATGGMNMVKSAYSSGKPAYGVGAGNVQVIFDRNINFDKAVHDVIQSRSFDNGIICAGDQCLICHENDFIKIIQTFENSRGHFVSNKKDAEKIRKAIFKDKELNRDIVGKTTLEIASYAKINIPEGKKILLVQENGTNDPLRREKMYPILLICTYSNFEEGVDIAQSNLNLEGKGHTCVIHTDDKAKVKYTGNKLTVSRLVVNQPGISAGGSNYNGFYPTNTLGCGSWGNNSISENLTYKHLINIQQVGLKIENSIIDNLEKWTD